MPTSDISSVRGIGVAVSVSTSTLTLSFFIASLCCTPKRCSSSTTSRPRSLNLTSLVSRRWVPITQSTSPVRSPSITALAWALVRNRDEHLDADRVAGEAVGERVAVLVGEQRRRREHGDLLAVLDRLERGPDRDLGLAEPDVAAHQAVHRVGPLHVALDVVDRAALVGRLDVRERVLHLVLPRRVGPERVAVGVDPLLVEHDELLGDLAHRRPDLALRLGEVAAAEAVQRRRLAADVLAQRVDLVGRHVQLVAALVGDEQVVALDAADRALDHALVLADAVLVVHDVVAGLEVLEEARRSRAVAGGRCGAMRRRPVRSASATIASLGVRQRAAAVQRRDDDAATGTGGPMVVASPSATGRSRPWSSSSSCRRCAEPVAVGGDDDAVLLGEQLAQPFVEPARVADDRAPAGGLDDRRVRASPASSRSSRTSPLDASRRSGDRRAGGGTSCRGRGPTSRRAPWRGRPPRRAARSPGRACAAARRSTTLACVGQHVGEQLVVVDEPRQPRLHAVEVQALGEALPLLAAPRLGGDELVGPATDVVGRHQLAGREDHHLVEVVGRALVVDAERRQAVDLVAPQVDADRGVGGRREDVDDRARAGRTRRGARPAPRAGSRSRRACSDELVGIDESRSAARRSARRRRVRARASAAGRARRRRRCAGVLVGVAQPPQHLEPLPHRLDAGAHPLERQRLPRREEDDLAVAAGTGGGRRTSWPAHRAGRAGDDERTPRRQLRRARRSAIGARRPRRRRAGAGGRRERGRAPVRRAAAGESVSDIGRSRLRCPDDAPRAARDARGIERQWR